MTWSAFTGIILLTTSLQAQTCCSGGVPMSGNIGLPAEEARSLQFSLSYDLNLLRTLKSGIEVFNDESRERTTQTYLLQLGYQVTDRIAVEVLLPYILQKRTIEQFGGINITETSGLGDMVLLIKYTIWDDFSWTIRSGAGAKLATGASDKTFRSITLNADLQPGSGANDLILWSGINHSMGWRPSMIFNVMGIYRFTGVNDHYLNFLTYEFGNELSVLAGVSDQLVLGSLLLSPSVSLRYRNVQTDQQNEFPLPNTGGAFIFLRPGILLNWMPDISFSMYSEIPLIANVGGIQLSPTARYNIGVSTTLDFSDNEGI